MPERILRCVLPVILLCGACLQNLRGEEVKVKPSGGESDAASAADADAAAGKTGPSSTAKTTTVAKPVIPPDAAKLPATVAGAQKERSAGHSGHGEAFNEGPRQKAYLMGGTGNVHFPITTRVPRAQQFFDQGVGQLHGFWYFEAERSFRQVAALDPDCAMAYWGMAMANANNEKRAKDFMAKASEKKAAASPREAAWIDALAASLAGEDTTARRKKYIRDLEAIVHEYPNDVEAKAFLALHIWKNGSWMTDAKKQLPIVSHQAVDSILEQVLAANPMHPAHHYRIHLWDYEKAARALISASRCGQSSPSVAHMWHMPGHIYSKLHRYADAVWQQEASARVDHAHMMRDRVLPDQIHNYAHNNEWLIRNLAFLGRVDDALDLAKNMVELPRHPKYNTLEKRNGSSHFGHARLADVLAQYERWNDIVACADTRYLHLPQNTTDERIKRMRLLGTAWFGQGNLDQGRKQIAAAEALLKERRAARYTEADQAEAKAVGEKKSDADVAKAMADTLARVNKELKNIERLLDELRVYEALADGKPAQATTLLAKVKSNGAIRRDHQARLYSLAGDHKQAESLARSTLKSSPGQVYPLAVLVDVLARAGKKQEAHAEFAKLRTLAAHADLDNPVFERLRPVADELGLPADWRIKAEPSIDVGQRPELNTLGPFRWEPTPATSWTLPGADGNDISLDQYRGKPVVVIFYLGSGCLHCVEQLQKFAPLAAKYAEAGIAIVAISSEPLDTLKGSLAKLSPAEPMPFPLAADPDLVVFKDYRAYDDFENMALHGTFLIDGAGLVRWHDVSYEPFLEGDFLLGEATRLLGQ